VVEKTRRYWGKEDFENGGAANVEYRQGLKKRSTESQAHPRFAERPENCKGKRALTSGPLKEEGAEERWGRGKTCPGTRQWDSRILFINMNTYCKEV